MMGIPGTSMDKNTEALIREYSIGGVILFSRNIEDPLQVAKLCGELQERALHYHHIPLFLAIDQEGGRVARLKEPFSVFPGNTAIGNDARPVDKAREFAKTTAEEMKLVGLNMDFAPVIDVARGEVEEHLADRTFGDNAKHVALLGETVIRGLQNRGVLAVAKHFPGLGKATVDPHYQLPTIPIEKDEIETINLPPFVSAIRAGVSGVMTSHAVYPALDPEYPATLSRIVLRDLLRKRLGFQGLIITDDLEMGAVQTGWGVAKGAIASFEAGADILLICKEQEKVLESIALLRKMIMEGDISMKRLHESLDRIHTTKVSIVKESKRVSIDEVRTYFHL
jgi:beta-N-acetylhexosaminidase